MKLTQITRAAATTLGALMVAVAVGGPAYADPAPATDYRVLAGVGSDTTQDVMNGLGEAITGAGGAKIVASWDARGSAQIKTKAANCQFPRPDGSGAGRTALRASEGESGGIYQGANVLGCVDFARSSSAPSGTPGTTGLYTYVSFGVDGVTYAISADSDLPSNLTLVQLQRIYRCLTTKINGVTVTPLLIQSGSGTRSFWNSKMGISESEISAGDYPCLQSLGDTVQEHDGRVLNNKPNYLVPFSIGQFIAQENAGRTVGGVLVNVQDRRGQATLGKISGVGPRTGAGGFTGSLNINFPLTRDVYNVIPTSRLSNPTVASTFLGANSAVCTRQEVINAFGFGFRASTGSQPADLLQQGCGDAYLKANG
ncbi:hypothetical protein AB0C02_00345 [Micromonospora sp. NPDC048999]|uniref:hypothetical protein n=1 Tax=Micromonospora sp. NPDC048999 TaxID=3155391 RepID=UPI0033F5E276